MTTRPIKTAELALGLYLGDFMAPQLPEGRLKGKMEKLSAVIMDEFKRTARLTKSEVAVANGKVMKLMDATGWHGKPRAVLTLVNFLLALYDRKPYAKKAIPVLMDIHDYFARNGLTKPASEWSAAMAADKWEDIVND